MANVEAFIPQEVDILKHLTTIDNLFRSLKGDEEKHRLQLNGIKSVMKKLRAKNSLQVQVANGLMEDVTPTIRGELISNTNKNFNSMNDAYKGLVEQSKHRADEVGEARIRMLKMLVYVLRRQHKFTDKEIAGFMVDKPVVEDKRDKDETMADIDKALEAEKNG